MAVGGTAVGRGVLVGAPGVLVGPPGVLVGGGGAVIVKIELSEQTATSEIPEFIIT